MHTVVVVGTDLLRMGGAMWRWETPAGLVEARRRFGEDDEDETEEYDFEEEEDLDEDLDEEVDEEDDYDEDEEDEEDYDEVEEEFDEEEGEPKPPKRKKSWD